MSDNKKFNRRDFMKMGGLAALSLPAINKVGTISGDDLLESEEEYGGFLVRTRGGDDPPYQVDDTVYQRFSARNTIFGRQGWDMEYMERVNNSEVVYTPNTPGYTHLDSALNAGAIFVGGFAGSAVATALGGMHVGLFSLTPDVMEVPQGPSFPGRWEHSVMQPEEVRDMVKKAAKFYGASLAGVAPMDPRWIYNEYSDMLAGIDGPIEIVEVPEIVLPEGQVTSAEAGQLIKAELETWEGSEIKAFLVDVIENTPAEEMPPGAPPIGMIKSMPAGQFSKMLDNFAAMPAPMLRRFIEKLEMDVEIAQMDPGDAAKPRYEGDTLVIPDTMKYVIVLGFEMDYDGIEATPTTLSNAATFDGYSKMAITAGSLTAFIRALGYNAIPCGNNTGLSVPMAIDAGLGEQGRNGILITPRYGPRIRLAKVITDLPMATDKPIKFGVEEFCNVCKKCAELCPTQAISYGEKTNEALNFSNNPGATKWYIDGEECYIGWTINGSGCGQCIRVCPFNKPEGWLHDATRILIGAKAGPLDSLLVNLDDASGYGKPEPNFKFWDSDDFIHIK